MASFNLKNITLKAATQSGSKRDPSSNGTFLETLLITPESLNPGACKLTGYTEVNWSYISSSNSYNIILSAYIKAEVSGTSFNGLESKVYFKKYTTNISSDVTEWASYDNTVTANLLYLHNINKGDYTRLFIWSGTISADDLSSTSSSKTNSCKITSTFKVHNTANITIDPAFFVYEVDMSFIAYGSRDPKYYGVDYYVRDNSNKLKIWKHVGAIKEGTSYTIEACPNNLASYTIEPSGSFTLTYYGINKSDSRVYSGIETYSFNGWDGYTTGKSVIINSDIRVDAKPYILTDDSITYSKIGNLPSPPKDGNGKKYNGEWYYSSNFNANTKVDPFDSVTDNIKIYPKYTNCVLTVKYDSQGGKSTPTDGNKYAYNSKFNIAAAITKTPSTTTTYPNLVVNFDKNGKNTDNVPSITIKSTSTNKPVTVTSQIVYAFNPEGWNSKANGTGDWYKAGNTVTNTLSSTKNETLTLYAIWSESSPNITTTIKGSITLPSIVNPVGYEFIGWYDRKTGGNLIGKAGVSWKPTANNMTLYAHWTPIKRTVKWKYYYDDGNKLEESSNTYTIESNPLSVPAPPASKTMGVDYTFYGWTYGENSSADGLGDWDQRKGVYSKPSDLPFKGVDVSAPKTFNGKNLTEYRNWGQYPKGYTDGRGNDLTGQIIPSTDKKNYVDITQYLFGCWIVTGKYVKVKEGNTSTYKKINSIYVKLENGSWKEIEDVYYRTTSGWKREVGKKEEVD